MSSHLDYQHFRREEHCTEEGCRARKFYIEDGKKFCNKGHEQAGFTQTQVDEDDWNTQGKKSRKKREHTGRQSQTLRGSKARELYLQCYQLILRKQCQVLIDTQGFPIQLETVVRDLWSLRLGSLHRSREQRSGYGSGTGTGTDTVMLSSSQGETTDTDVSGFKSMSSRTSRKSARNLSTDEKLPKMVETLVLCYLGILLLRLPTGLGELYKWATCDETLFDRPIKAIPMEMRMKLPASFQSAFEFHTPLGHAALHSTLFELIDFYHIEFDIEFPSLNVPLLLSKHLRGLGLSDIYPAVRRLAVLLEMEFRYPTSRVRSAGMNSYPDVKIISLIVIATKLSQPFDEVERLSKTEMDPTAIKIDWNLWSDTIHDATPIGLKRGEAVTLTDRSVVTLDERKIDDYLGWYQRTWIDDREFKMSKPVLDIFPLTNQSSAIPDPPHAGWPAARLKRVYQNLKPQRSTSHKALGVKQPGEDYRRYKSVDGIPENARVFYEMAASVAGIPLKMLVEAVYKLEGRVMGWNLEERRNTSEKD